MDSRDVFSRFCEAPVFDRHQRQSSCPFYSSSQPLKRPRGTPHLLLDIMADKEATVFVIDLGSSMGKRDREREMTNLEWSMQFVWDKITAKAQYPSFNGI